MDEPTRLRTSGSASIALALEAEVLDARRISSADVGRRVNAAISAGSLPWTDFARATWRAHALFFLVGVGAGAAGHALWRGPLEPTREAPVAPTTRITASAAEVPPPPPPAPPVTPEPAPAPPARGAPPAKDGTLIDELRLYERARAALEAGRAGVAIVEFRRYRQLYPRGRLLDDVHRGLIEALVLAGRHEEADDERATLR